MGQDEKNATDAIEVTGLDTLAWKNIRPVNHSRYAAHLLMAILVVIWVCGVFFFELRAFIKVRQDYLTSAEHRLRASATTVLVNSIPKKWASEEALRGLFDVFPGGVRNIWLNRDMSKLLDKVNLRKSIHSQLENAETDLIKAAKRAQLKKQKKEDKKNRRNQNLAAFTRKERAAQNAELDKDAKKLARSGWGEASGETENVPHDVADGVQQSEKELRELGHDKAPEIADAGVGLQKIRPGRTFSGKTTGSNGFATMPSGEVSRTNTDGHLPSPLGTGMPESRHSHSHGGSVGSAGSTAAIQKHQTQEGNTVRQLVEQEKTTRDEKVRFWQFWKPPSGGYASPIPQGADADDYFGSAKEPEKGTWQTVKGFIPFMGDEEEEVEYEPAYESDIDVTKEESAEWAKYLKKKHRPTHHLSLFGVNWLCGLPFFTEKVDTIYWCRRELARLNVEIEDDQKHPERFPPMNSAFVQFNHQVAAHMACQSIVHHIPRQMAPLIIEISPTDVIWDNMAISWWLGLLRNSLVTVVVCGMIFLWAIPVAATAALSQLDTLIEDSGLFPKLSDHENLERFFKAIAGVLPAAVLGLLLVLIPFILTFLAGIKGARTGAQKTEFVQVYYFVFLFIQVFLVVSIASFFTASISVFVANIAENFNSFESVLQLLATQLPKAANYFFSYMILQAMSTSSGTLLQIGALFVWYIIGPMFDSTARNKWTRNTNLNTVRWGAVFPVYTNFACIALVYSIIAPLISIFAIITFGLLWLAQRYAMVYVYRLEHDTGGALYPRAVNQTFTGLYFMQLCMTGLFFTIVDENEDKPCIPHGIVMIVVFVLTAIYQILLNKSFGPLFRYLPITFEDEAVLRDEAFQRAQDTRLGLRQSDDETESDEDLDVETRTQREKSLVSPDGADGIEMDRLDSHSGQPTDALFNPVRQVGTWTMEGGKQMGKWAKGGGNQLLRLTMTDRNSKAAQYRKQQRKKDLEAQRAIGDALFGGVHDEIEDLTPNERDVLTRHAFLHSALRARRPTVWIPKDDLGISEDEIRRTQEFSKNIWISNEGTALDSKLRVVCGKNPPDFSEVDLINL